MKTASTSAAVAALLCAQGALAFDLKGIKLGALTSESEVRAKLKADQCDRNGCSARYPKGFPAGTQEVDVFVDAAWRVTGIIVHFDPDAFAEYDRGLRAKFGPPQRVERQVLQNGFGARFPQTYEGWRDKAGNEVWLIRRIDMTEGRLMFMNATEVAKKDARDNASHSGL
jgi:hypothetical protein